MCGLCANGIWSAHLLGDLLKAVGLGMKSSTCFPLGSEHCWVNILQAKSQNNKCKNLRQQLELPRCKVIKPHLTNPVIGVYSSSWIAFLVTGFLFRCLVQPSFIMIQCCLTVGWLQEVRLEGAVRCTIVGENHVEQNDIRFGNVYCSMLTLEVQHSKAHK